MGNIVNATDSDLIIMEVETYYAKIMDEVETWNIENIDDYPVWEMVAIPMSIIVFLLILYVTTLCYGMYHDSLTLARQKQVKPSWKMMLAHRHI